MDDDIDLMGGTSRRTVSRGFSRNQVQEQLEFRYQIQRVPTAELEKLYNGTTSQWRRRELQMEAIARHDNPDYGPRGPKPKSVWAWVRRPGL